MPTVRSPTWYSLRRLNGTFGQSAFEFYCGDGLFVILLIAAVPVAIIGTAANSEFTIPPSKPSDWYLIALLVVTVCAAWFLVPRAGRSVEIDGTNIVVRSRVGRVLAKVPLADLSDARVDVYQGEGADAKTLVLITSRKSYYVPLPAALEREL
jgi:hypothetical protein